MSGEFDAAGTAIEGALLSGAVEQEQSNGNVSDNVSAAECLNCGSVLSGNFCSQCGQKAHIHRSIAGIWHDIAHGVLHFDGKLWRTLPMLALKPGELTRRYIRGQRANFISPMALFLFSIFMMFAIFSVLGGPNMPENNSEFNQALDKEFTETNGEIAKLEEVIISNIASKEDVESATLQQNTLKKAANGIANIQGKDIPYPMAGLNPDDGGIIQASGEIDTGNKTIDNALTAAAQKANKNPTLLLYKLKSNGYKFAWLLIPLSLPFVWIATLGTARRPERHHFYDHAIFTTYSISFMCLLFLICSLLDMIGFGFAWIALVIIPPIHLYKQLKNTYQLGRWNAIARLIILCISISIILVLFLLILLFLGILG